MRLRTLLMAVPVTALVLLPLPSDAQVPADEGRIGLTVSPPLVELSANPGGTARQTFTVYNEGRFGELVEAEVRDWAPGEDGASVVFPDEPTEYSMAAWMRMRPRSARIPAGESAEFTLTIRVPADAGPGGKYGSVNFTPVRDPVPGAVQVQQVVSALVLMEISGAVLEAATLAEFGTRLRAAPGSAGDAEDTRLFATTGSMDFLARIRNVGNVHLRPTVLVDVQDVFGRSAATVDNSAVGPGLVLPGSTRAYRVAMAGGLWPGYYRAQLTASYADGRPPLTATTTFWYVPMWVRIGIPLLVVALIAFVVYRRSRRDEDGDDDELTAEPTGASAEVPRQRGRHRAVAPPAPGAAPRAVPGPRQAGTDQYGDPAAPGAPPDSAASH